MSNSVLVSIIFFLLGIGTLVIAFLIIRFNKKGQATEKQLLKELKQSILDNKNLLEQTQSKLQYSVDILSTNVTKINAVVNNTNKTANDIASDAGFTPANTEDANQYQAYLDAQKKKK